MTTPTIKPRTSDRLSWTAHHEAGHAVLDIRLGLPHQGRMITIEPDDVSLGRFEGEDAMFSSGQLDDQGDWVPDANGIDKKIVALFSGCFSAMKAGQPKTLARQRSWSDYEKISEFLSFTMTTRQALRKRAIRMVTKNWIAIHAVAEELLHRKRLDNLELEWVVELADGREEAAFELAQYRSRRRQTQQPRG